MIATVINAAAVLIGSLLGLFFKSKISERFSDVIFTAVGLSTLIIGMSMGLAAQRVLYLVLSLVLGGIAGTALNIEKWILNLGELLKRLIRQKNTNDASGFAEGFLDSSVLFCVGAMAILGCLQAGVEGKYDLILIKSAMDGFISILLAATMGVGVAFSALSILLYQGALTFGATWISPLMSDLMISELRGVGGALVFMIGFNLLKIKVIKTANFIPALIFAVIFATVDPYIQAVLKF